MLEGVQIGMLHRLVYNCHATRHISPDDHLQIAQDSTQRNERLGVTGLLLYANRRSVQVLEGEPAAIFEVLHAIAEDERASAIRVESIEPADERIFEAWSAVVAEPGTPGGLVARHFNELLNLFATHPGSPTIRQPLNDLLGSVRHALESDLKQHSSAS